MAWILNKNHFYWAFWARDDDKTVIAVPWRNIDHRDEADPNFKPCGILYDCGLASIGIPPGSMILDIEQDSVWRTRWLPGYSSDVTDDKAFIGKCYTKEHIMEEEDSEVETFRASISEHL